MYLRSFVWSTSMVVVLMPLTWAGDVVSAARVYATKTWEVAIPHGFAGQPKPKFDRGLFLVRDVDFSLMSVYRSSGEPVKSPSGELLRWSRFSLPDASQTSIADIAVSPAGALVLAGGARNADGQVANFLAWLSAAGAVERIVRTSPFLPLRICVTEDGSVWAAGRELDAERQKEIRNHPVLRRYDPEGRLTQSLLPREMFEVSDHPAHGGSTLTCGSDRIGFYSQRANAWIEVSPDGELLGRWRGVALDQATKAAGIGMTSDEAVYAAVHVSRPGSAEPRAALFQLDRSTGRWLSVSLESVLPSDPLSQYATIVGTDGTSLVLATTLPTFVAVRVESR